MSAPDLKSFANTGEDISGSEVEDDGSITLQLGDAESGVVENDGVPLYFPPGFMARPTPPFVIDINGERVLTAASAYTFRAGGDDTALGVKDNRTLIAGLLKEGDTCMYSNGPDGTGQARIFCKDKAISIYTRKDKDADAMQFSMNGKTDTIQLLNSQGAGLIIQGKRVLITNGTCTVDLDSALSLISSGTVLVDGSCIALGAKAVPVAGAVLCGTAGPMGKPSLKVIAE